MRRTSVWLPPLLWMAVILWGSSAHWDAERTGSMLVPWLRWLLPWATAADLATAHGIGRKLGHLLAYGILAVLWLRSLQAGTRVSRLVAVAVALGVTVTWAIVDELHQATVPSRTGSAGDVALDAVGASIALLVVVTGWRWWADRLISIILWTALVGGAAALAMDWVSDVDSRALLVTTPVAAVALALRARWRLTRQHVPGPRCPRGAPPAPPACSYD